MKFPLVIDANLLLLWAVGTADVSLIKKHRRLYPRYVQSHFDFLLAFLNGYDRFIVTPHGLAEMWNLIGERSSGQDPDFERILRAATQMVQLVLEVHKPASNLIDYPEIAWLGISDIAHLDAALSNNAALISTDGMLCHEARKKSVSAFGFWSMVDPTA